MFTRFFVSLYHTQVMKDSRAYNFKRCEQVPYINTSIDSQEAIEYINHLKFSKF